MVTLSSKVVCDDECFGLQEDEVENVLLQFSLYIKL